MPPHRTVRRVEPEDDITADDRNYLAEEIERLQIIEGVGIRVEATPLGQIVHAPTYPQYVGALTPSGGIAAATGSPPTPGSETCQIYDILGSGPWQYRGYSRKVYNDLKSTNNIAGSTYITCIMAPDGTIRALGEGCS